MYRVSPLVQVLSTFCLLIGGHSTIIKQNAALLTKNAAYYEGNFNYTIENFLELPFPESHEGYFFDSAVFPSADDASGMKWHFRTYPRLIRNGQKGLDVDLRLISIPDNSSFPIVTFQCGLIDIKGNIRYLKKSPEKKLSLSTGIFINPLISRDTLVSKASELLPGGHLTLQCGVKGFIKNKTVKYETTILSVERPHYLASIASDCGKKLASDNMQRLAQKNFDLSPDIKLEASGKQFKRHKEILSAHSSVLSSLIAKYENNLSAVLNFDKEMNAMELEDMLHFLYQGNAANLDQTCRNLYVVAKKYQLECLMDACEEVLIKKISTEPVFDLLKYGAKHGALRLIEAAAIYISKHPDKCTISEN